jgi:hypothetical protein
VSADDGSPPGSRRSQVSLCDPQSHDLRVAVRVMIGRGEEAFVRYLIVAEAYHVLERAQQPLLVCPHAALTVVTSIGRYSATYRNSARFPDRQLFIDLHAHTPGREPVRSEDALAELLTAVGVDPRYLPGDLDSRAAMRRDRMAGQWALALDNAASTRQVVPLLPGAAVWCW